MITALHFPAQNDWSKGQDSNWIRIFSGMQTPRLGVIKRNFSGSLNWDKLNLAPLLSSETRSDLKQRGEIIDRGGEEDEGDLVLNSMLKVGIAFSALFCPPIQPCILSKATILNWLFPLGIYRILNKRGGGGWRKEKTNNNQSNNKTKQAKETEKEKRKNPKIIKRNFRAKEWTGVNLTTF